MNAAKFTNKHFVYEQAPPHGSLKHDAVLGAFHCRKPRFTGRRRPCCGVHEACVRRSRGTVTILSEALDAIPKKLRVTVCAQTCIHNLRTWACRRGGGRRGRGGSDGVAVMEVRPPRPLGCPPHARENLPASLRLPPRPLPLPTRPCPPSLHLPSPTNSHYLHIATPTPFPPLIPLTKVCFSHFLHFQV